MNDSNFNPQLFTQILKTMNMKAAFYAEVSSKVETCDDDEELAKWLRQYVAVHKESIESGEPAVWD